MTSLIYKPERISMKHIADSSASQTDQGTELPEAPRSMHRTAPTRPLAQPSSAAAAAGKTAKGKDSTGRTKKASASEVSAWKKANKATVAETAKHFDLPPTIAKRWCAVA